MAKKKKSNPKYKSFRLYGNHNPRNLFWYIVLDLVFAVALGLILQPQITQVLAAH